MKPETGRRWTDEAEVNTSVNGGDSSANSPRPDAWDDAATSSFLR